MAVLYESEGVSIDLQLVAETLQSIARKVGKVIKENTGKVAFDDKKNAVDLVTQVDKQVEQTIYELLESAKLPFQYDFLGEESFSETGEAATALSDAPTFIIDPIDGTTNFIHGFPFSVTSLGFAIDRKPVVGVVYNPHLDLMYYGIHKGGSFLNGEPLGREARLSKPLTLQSSLLAIEWGAERDGPNYDAKAETYRKLAAADGGMVHGCRSMGSAAMDLCFVAQGTFDAYWEGGYWPWDVCAGWVIVEEAGGKMVGACRGNWDPSLEERAYLAVRATPGAEKAPGKEGFSEQQVEFIEAFWGQVAGDLKY